MSGSQAGTKAWRGLMGFLQGDDYEWVEPPARFPGDARLDEPRAISDRCEVGVLVDSAFELLGELRRGGLLIFDGHDIERLARSPSASWTRFVDPDLSLRGPERRRPRIVLYECPSHILELRGIGQSWQLFQNGKKVRRSAIKFEEDPISDDDPFEPDPQDEEYEMTVAEREHLLGRAQQAERKAKVAAKEADEEVEAAKTRVRQAQQAAAEKVTAAKTSALQALRAAAAEVNTTNGELARERRERKEVDQQLAAAEAEVLAERRAAKENSQGFRSQLRDSKKFEVELQSRLSELEQTSDDLALSEAAQRRRSESDRVELARLNGQISHHESLRLELDGQLSARMFEKEQLVAQLKTASEDLLAERTRVGALNQQLDEIRADLSSMKRDRDGAQADLNELHDQIYRVLPKRHVKRLTLPA